VSEPVEKVLLEALASDCPAFVIVGDDAAARALVRACAGSAAEGGVLIGFARDGEGWPSGGPARVMRLEGELTPVNGLRAALRQDPDFLLLEAPAGEVPWELIVTATQTGHGALVRVEACLDERVVLDALRPLADWARAALPRVVVCDPRGVARIVDTGSGDAVWSRGQAAPSREVATGRRPRVPPPPVVREPIPPLEPAVFDSLRRVLAPLVRRVFVPVLEEPAGDAARSKLGGLPLLLPGEEWPRCPSCGLAMPLAFQLAKAELPEGGGAWWRGDASHFQFFYCCSTGCDVEDGWEAFAKNRLIRFIDGGEPAASVPRFEQTFASRDIVSWESAEETPANDDVPGLSEDLREARWRLADRAHQGDASPEERVLAGPRNGQKLLGWPRWTQGVEWATCPRCGERMELVFQIDADEGPLEMLFAADGTGHVSRCPEHEDVLAFRWACG
jgi:hypothetical protein